MQIPLADQPQPVDQIPCMYTNDSSLGVSCFFWPFTVYKLNPLLMVEFFDFFPAEFLLHRA